ncbi:DNA primase [uncultured Caudovirales phage]|uniref:DNA primase n=1 Tax=uncultured Caudovirales phage TaxID=2100421 RepID=A0A6J5LJP2_9CAUD|nr:DNA primase [uncultured Caudovirales phage]
MSVFIDRTFLLRLSPKLIRFSRKKDDLYNFRCPLCGDSTKNKIKCRGYIFRKKNDYFYMCHNCGISTTFYNFLKQVDPSMVAEYSLERYKNGEASKNTKSEPDFEAFKTEKPEFKSNNIHLPTIESLPDTHYAKSYVHSRKIPKDYESKLYFAEDFKAFVDGLGVEKDGLREKDPRLVIPFYNKERELIGLQGRALGESKLRYITVKMHDDNKKIYGLDKLDLDKTVYVVEGPIDSMFLDNAVATMDSNLASISDIIDKSKVVLVYDNEPRNKDIVRTMEKAIDEHYNVVIWPEMMDDKDINDMILTGFTSDEIQDIIEKNTFVNLAAKMRFINWKKV